MIDVYVMTYDMGSREFFISVDVTNVNLSINMEVKLVLSVATDFWIFCLTFEYLDLNALASHTNSRVRTYGSYPTSLSFRISLYIASNISNRN